MIVARPLLAPPPRDHDLTPMRKLGILIIALVAIHVVFLFVHPAGGAETTPSRATTDVGIVFDVGGRGDKSFNDGAYAGAQLATRELGARFRFIEPGDGSDREAGLRLLAAEGMDLVVGVGFIFTDDLNALAKEYPNTKFAGIDYSVSTDAQGNPLPPPPNLAAVVRGMTPGLSWNRARELCTSGR